MKRHQAFILGCIFLIFNSVGILRSSAQGVCSNFDFAYGDFFNWTGKTGIYRGDYRPSNIFEWTTSNIPSSTLPSVGSCSSYESDEFSGRRFTILPRRPPGVLPTDPFSSGRLPKYPSDTNFKYVVRLGNACSGAEAESLIFHYSPTNLSNLLLLNYAIMLESPHPGLGLANPTFEIRVKADGVVTQALKCAELRLSSDTRDALVLRDTAYHILPVGSTNPSYLYRSWTKVGIDLRLYQGQDIEVEIAIGDCSWSGHFGYSYFSGTCASMKLDSIAYYGVTEGSDTVNRITAPDGFTYVWYIENAGGRFIANTVLPSGNIDSLQKVLSLVDANFGDLSKIKVSCELTSLVVGTDGNRCKASLQIDADNNRPVADFEMFIDQCDTSRSVSFTTTSVERASPLDSGSIKWDFGDGTTDTVPHPVHRYAAPGTYVINYSIASEAGIRSYKTDSITIEPLPVALIDLNQGNPGNSSKICPEETLNLKALNLRAGGRDTCLWIANDEEFYGNAYTDIIDNTTTIQLIVADTKTGCKDSSFHTVNVIPRPEITFTGDSIICMGNTTTITAYSDYGIKYWWSEGTQGASITKTPMSDTSFTVYSENEVPNCISNKTVNISMTIPKLESTKLTICPGETVVLTASEAFAYQWTPTPADTNLSESDLLQPQLIVSPSQTTTYSVTGKGQNGCSADPLSRTVKVYPYPTARFEYTPNYIDSENPVVAFRDRSDNAYTILWDFGDGATTEQRNPSHKYTDLSKDSMRVFIKVLNELGCSDSTFKYLPIGIFAVWSSNSFTPEASTNNIFKFYSKNMLSNFSLVIYDRWGQQVFQSNNINLGWDGTYKGKKCPTGSYVWIMSYKRPESNRTYQEKGNVNLIR